MSFINFSTFIHVWGWNVYVKLCEYVLLCKYVIIVISTYTKEGEGWVLHLLTKPQGFSQNPGRCLFGSIHGHQDCWWICIPGGLLCFLSIPPQKKKKNTFFPMFVTLPKTTNKFAPENWQTCCEFQGVCLEDHPRTDVKWLMTIGFRFRPLRNVPLPNGQTSLHGL